MGSLAYYIFWPALVALVIAALVAFFWGIDRIEKIKARFHQAENYKNDAGKYLCPLCFNLNKDNWPVRDAAGRVLEGGCQECWESQTGQMYLDFFGGENPINWKATAYRPGVMALAAIRTGKRQERKGK